jgi:hypothetical protein
MMTTTTTATTRGTSDSVGDDYRRTKSGERQSVTLMEDDRALKSSLIFHLQLAHY